MTDESTNRKRSKKQQLNDALLRLYSIVQGIPGAHIGVSNQSATVSGVITFAKDMNAIKQPLQLAIHFIRIEDYKEAEWLLSTLEAWMELRKAQGWKDVFPFPMPKEF